MRLTRIISFSTECNNVHFYSLNIVSVEWAIFLSIVPNKEESGGIFFVVGGIFIQTKIILLNNHFWQKFLYIIWKKTSLPS